MNLSELPNIGKVLAARLVEVGIENGEQLRAVGSREAFTRLKMVDQGACLSKLCALEGAIQGIRWHHLSADVKDDLKKYFASQGR